MLRTASRFILSLALVGIAAGSSFAQQVDWRQSPQSVQAANAPVHDDGFIIHRTPELLNSAEGQAALAEIRRLKGMNLLNKRSGSNAAITPGAQRDFQLLQFGDCSNTNSCAYSETFTLVASEPLFNIWVANSDLASNGGHMVEADWQEMTTALGSATPSASWNPAKGIVEINEEVYGPPSDVDGNDKIDVLVHDIKDGYDGVNNLGFSVGYFSPSDVAPSPSGNGNLTDIIHLDTVPSLYSLSGTRRATDLVLATLAHEFQHLIFAVSHAGNDLTFLNEGLSEWAEVVNGYAPRSISYLADPGELSRSMLDWRSSPYGGDESEDYQRGGLFHHYLAERLSTTIVGAISSGSGSGVGNYTKMLTDNGLDVSLLRDLVQGFHVANLINDQTLSPAFGYENPFRTQVQASGYATIDGTQALNSSTTGNLNPGAVRYVHWSRVGDFTLDITASSGGNRLMPLLIMQPAIGSMQIAFPEVGGETTFIEGDFEDVYLVLPHVDLTTAGGATYATNASWNVFDSSSQFQNVTYDTGEIATNNDGFIIGYGIGGGVSGLSIPVESEFANVFEVPEGAALTSVEVSLLFFSDVDPGSTTSSVRDFTLKVYADQNGSPGELLLSKQIVYNGPASVPQLAFQTVDLSSDINILELHQGNLYVSITDAGSDDNHVVLPMAVSGVTDSPSFLYTNFSDSGLGWAPFDAVTSGGASIFDGYVVPIRATVDLLAGATDAEELDTLPRTLVLEQNYPNPFNPTTQIRFQLPTSSQVQVQVFDLLGRNVATLVDGPLTAGAHEVSFDASNLTSGLYLYTITTADQRLTRTMTLIK